MNKRALNTISTLDHVEASKGPIPCSNSVEPYLTDESSSFKGVAEKVFLPRCEAEVVQLMREMYSRGVEVTVSGSGTSLTGARVPFGGIVISMEQMTSTPMRPGFQALQFKDQRTNREYRVLTGVDQKGSFMIAPPGITLEIVEEVLKPMGLMYPPDPTEKTATMGGSVATNASGSRSFRYGPTRSWVRRLRVVLPFGEVLEVRRGEVKAVENRFIIETSSRGVIHVPLPTMQMPRVRKNSAGLFVEEGMDLIDLFIGSEGILGIFTEIEVSLTQSRETFQCLAFYPSRFQALAFVEKVMSLSRKPAGKPFMGDFTNPLSLEYYDGCSLKFLDWGGKSPIPIPGNAEAAVEFEQEVDEETLEVCMEKWDELLDEFHPIQTYVAFTEDEKRRLVEFRHSLPEAVNQYVRTRGVSKVATDVAVPEDETQRMIDFYEEVGRRAQTERVNRRLGLSPTHIVSMDDESLIFKDEKEAQGLKVASLYFGHIGDSHLHLNFLPESHGELEYMKNLALEVVKKGVELGGTVSAEHGVGKKFYLEDGTVKPLLELMYSKEVLLGMAKLKLAFDPKGVLNVGNMFPKEYLTEAANRL